MSDTEKTSYGGFQDPEKAADLSPQATVHKGEVKAGRQIHADPNDGDIALQAFADGEPMTFTAEEEKALLRKIDWNLMPVCCYYKFTSSCLY